MKYKVALISALLVLASSANGQVVYCKDIGGGKTHCSGNGGMTIHRFGNMMVIPNAMPVQPHTAPALPNPLMQNNTSPTLNDPYSQAGTQHTLPTLPPPTYPQPQQPAASGAPVIVVPHAGSRICHQFGTTLVCN